MERSAREKWMTLVENCGTMVRRKGALRTDVDPRILLYVGFLQNCDMYSGEQDSLIDQHDDEYGSDDDDSAAAMQDFHVVWEKPWVGAVRCAICGPPPTWFQAMPTLQAGVILSLGPHSNDGHGHSATPRVRGQGITY